jgi:hypothetical protein
MTARVLKILEAQQTVEHRFQMLEPLAIDDERFDGALVAYQAAIDHLRACERIGR